VFKSPALGTALLLCFILPSSILRFPIGFAAWSLPRKHKALEGKWELIVFNGGPGRGEGR